MKPLQVEILLNDRYKQAPPFNEDEIRRSGLPSDVFGILHDLAYHHEGRDVWDYVRRAQVALRTESFPYRYAWDRMNRKGQFCRVLVRGKKNSALVEFEDGFKAVTSRNALRKRIT